MKPVRVVLSILMVAAFAMFVCAQIRPPDTGKLSWDLFQEAVAGQRARAVGQPVPILSALLTTTQPVTLADLTTLRDLGYTVLGAFGHFVLVSAPADLYADREKGVGGLDFVANATLPPALIENGGTAITDGTSMIRAEAAWGQGYRGQGQRIAVIDSGFDPTDPRLAQMNPTYYLVTPTADLIAYQVQEGIVAELSLHGTSCAIIVGDVAPEAELYLLSYPAWASLIGWLYALDFAVHQLGVGVIATAVEFTLPTCHADGTGLLNEAVSEILRDTDAVLVISAGNWAAGENTDRWFYASTFADSDGDQQHDFTSSTDVWDQNTLRFEAAEGTTITIILEWDDWDRATGTVDLDLLLFDADYKVLLGQSRTQQHGQTTGPFERIVGQLPYTGAYAIVIQDRGARWHGQSVQPVSFHLNVHASVGIFSQVEHHTACGSVREVATNPHVWVMAVGAVAVEDGTVRSYSSRGPTRSGQALPAIFAPDGVIGTAYHPHFYGTSASAPYVAGTIALLRSADGALSREELLAILREAADTTVDACGNPVHVVNVGTAIQQVIAR